MKPVPLLLSFLCVAPTVLAAEHRRDPWLWPFAGTSIWNRPIGSEARYVPAGLKAEGGFNVDVEILLRVAADAPERQLFAPKSWETRAGGTQHLPSVRINDQDTVPDARKWWTPNFCAALLMPDNRTVRHLAPLCRPDPGGPVFAYHMGESDLSGDGILGSHGASRMSALGGSVRLGELVGDAPIRHALKCCLFAKRYCYFGDDRKGFRWPAAGADGYADKQTYGGSNRAVVMGSLLALPPGADASRLQTPVGKKLAAALRDYGCYIVDDAAHDVFYLCAERGVEEEVEKRHGHKLSGWAALQQDILALLPLLAVVDNNAPDRIGGGGAPRAPLAPPLADAPAAPAPKNAPVAKNVVATTKLLVRNPSMTDGKDKPDHWTQTWVGKGKIKTYRDANTYRSAPASLALEAVDGAAQAQVSQPFEVKGGERLKLSGWVRADGGANAMLALQSFTADWKGIDFKVVGNAVTGLDWRRVEGEIDVPPNAARAAVVLMLQGPGVAWLDDVSLDGADPGAGAQPKSAVRPKPQGPPKARHSCDPAEGFYPDYPHAWRQIVDGQLKRTKEGPAPLVFVGDSLMQGWNEQPHWKDHYAKLGAVNFGVGGDGTPQVLWRIDKGILEGLNPRVVVLCIGVNNVWPGFDAADTVKGIEAVLARLKEKCPQAKVLLLGNTHFFDKGDGKSRQRVRTINAALAKLADGRRVRFFDFSEEMLDAGDALKPELYAGDKLHFSAKGYELWARVMDPALDALQK
jgi:lysophospholipase L1-like esterase